MKFWLIKSNKYSMTWVNLKIYNFNAKRKLNSLPFLIDMNFTQVMYLHLIYTVVVNFAQHYIIKEVISNRHQQNVDLRTICNT
jgi:hypothetical protein